MRVKARGERGNGMASVKGGREKGEGGREIGYFGLRLIYWQEIKEAGSKSANYTRNNK